jgi:hypothetical protein
MKVLVPGHTYELDHLDGPNKTVLQFVSRWPLHDPEEGVTNQEVLRAVIDRVQFLDSEVRWPLNDQIIWHLRQAIALHEARAFLRHIEKGVLHPEELPLGADGHIIIEGANHG